MSGRSLFAGALLFCSCAQVAQINGGERDTAPPVLLRAVPSDRSVHFSGDVILLQFDERIQLDRVRERLLVSPPLEEQPHVRIVGARSVEIRLMAPLKPNTTYSFNLGECIKDLTEGNAAAGLSYVVSTGAALDSASMRGAALNALTGEPEKDMLVVLHSPLDTGDFRTTRPAYMTRTDASGNFTIGNLPYSTFAVRALRDKNANFRYDLPNEEIAFLDSTVTLGPVDSLTPAVILRAFLPESPAQVLRGVKVVPDGALQLLFSKPVGTLSLNDIARTGGSLRWLPEWNTTRDSILMWPSDTTLVSDGHYEVVDNGTIIDTVRYRPLQRMPFHTGVQATLHEVDEAPFIQLRTTRPVRSMDTARFQLTMDSVPLAFRLVRDTTDLRSWSMQTLLPRGASAQLIVLPKAITDLYGGVNDTVRVPLGRSAEQATGSLRVKVAGLPRQDVPYILQVLDAQQRKVAQGNLTTSEPEVIWKSMAPGRCSLRLIEDRNGNGRWDTGEWTSGRQPERTWKHAEEVNIRASWDIVFEWPLE